MYLISIQNITRSSLQSKDRSFSKKSSISQLTRCLRSFFRIKHKTNIENSAELVRGVYFSPPSHYVQLMPLSPAHISHTRCCARSIFTLGAQISFAGSCIETPGTYYWYYVPACYSNISGVFEKHEKKKRPSCEIKKFFKTHL